MYTTVQGLKMKNILNILNKISNHSSIYTTYEFYYESEIF